MSKAPNSSRSAIFTLQEPQRDYIYPPALKQRISALVPIIEPPLDISRWRNASHEQLNAEIIFYGAGSISGFATPEMWQRGVRVTSAAAANAESVVEFTVGQILLAGKNALFNERLYRTTKTHTYPHCPGNFRTTLGLISLGWIGKKVAALMRNFTHKIIAYDPYATQKDASDLGLELVSLDEIFTRAHIISCHTPLLESTRGMLQEKHFRAMMPGATFINTARGAVVNEDDLCRVLAERPDIYAVLDVTTQEPPLPQSPLWHLPNVWLTPHIAGCLYSECERMGEAMLQELQRYLNGQPLLYELDEKRAQIAA
jgi:phosphoglycerate dehydrogenase-like enzyme